MNKKIEIRHEGMRIGGEVVFTEDVVEVHYPYTDESDRHGSRWQGRTCAQAPLKLPPITSQADAL